MELTELLRVALFTILPCRTIQPSQLYVWFGEAETGFQLLNTHVSKLLALTASVLDSLIHV